MILFLLVELLMFCFVGLILYAFIGNGAFWLIGIIFGLSIIGYYVQYRLEMRALKKKEEAEKRKHVVAVAAVIVRKGEYFATQRGYGDWKGWWEFPGGKIEAGETPQVALLREIREELNMEIGVGELITMVEYDYPKFHLTLHCYKCAIISGEPELLEHEDARWLSKEDLNTVKWLPADQEVVERL